MSLSEVHIRETEECRCCEYGVEQKLEIYEAENESEEIGYIEKAAYENDINYLTSESKEKKGEAYGIFHKGDKMVDEIKLYTVDGISVNERTNNKKQLTVNEGIISSPTRYLSYLYYHKCYLLIDSLTNKQVDLYGVRRVTNKNYLSEVEIPHFVLSGEICSQ